MKKIFAFVHFLEAINKRVGVILCYLLIPLVGIIILEILLRYVFNKPTIWSFELSKFIFGGIAVLSGGYVLYNQAHVRVDILYDRFSKRKKAILDVCTAFFFFLFCGILLYRSAGFAWDSIVSQETSPTIWHPVLWPIKSTVFVGAFLIILQGIAHFIRNLYIAITGKDWNRQWK